MLLFLRGERLALSPLIKANVMQTRLLSAKSPTVKGEYCLKEPLFFVLFTRQKYSTEYFKETDQKVFKDQFSSLLPYLQS